MPAYGFVDDAIVCLCEGQPIISSNQALPQGQRHDNVIFPPFDFFGYTSIRI